MITYNLCYDDAPAYPVAPTGMMAARMQGLPPFAPIREGYAEDVLIVTSGEKMALYAANNISTAVRNFEDRGYATVRGVIFNRRNIPDEESKVKAFADRIGVPIVADIPRSDDISIFEDQGMTVVEGDPDLPVSRSFIELAEMLLKDPPREEKATYRFYH